MTTPEKVRKRQRIEIGLVLLAFVIGLAGWVYADTRNQQIRTCVIEAFAVSSDVAQTRADLVERESALTDERFDAFEDFVDEVFAAETPEQAQVAKKRYDERKAAVLADLAAIRKERKDNPPPQFDVSTCL